MRTIKTHFRIAEIAEGGVLKEPKDKWGLDRIFFGEYFTLGEVNEAIKKHGEPYTDYVILTIKRVETHDDT